MKGEGIVQLMTMIAIKRSGVPLTRDIVFIGNADEELNSTGAFVFVDKHADLLKDVEFLMTEGGGNQVDERQARVLRRGRRREANVLAARLGEGHAVARVASHEAEPGAASRRRARQDREVRDAAARHAGVDKYFRDISRGYPGRTARAGWPTSRRG